MAEFSPQVLDSLRQPLETGETVIARANHRVTYPSRIQVIAAMNPCKCGESTPGQSCRRGPRCASDYQGRISGPLLDRFDMQIEVPAVPANELVSLQSSEPSETVRARVEAARQRQVDRYRSRDAGHVRTNAECSGHLLEQSAMPEAAGVELLQQAAKAMGVSARGVHRTLRVARTLADLDGIDVVKRVHVAEALSYRAETMRQKAAA